MRYLLALVLLVCHVAAYGQEVIPVAKRPSDAEVSSAKDTIKKAQADPVVIPFNGYALAPIDYPKKLKCYVVPGSDDCLKKIFLPKGAGYEGLLVSKGTGTVAWTVIAPDKEHDRYLIIGIRVGTSTLIWFANGATLDDEPVVIAGYQFVVGEKPPTPDPKPPGPGPNPPQPVPIPGAGFRVLIVTETKDLSTLPSAQVQAMTAKEVTDYLDAHCVQEGGQPEYRRFDQNVNMEKASKTWQDAMNRVLGVPDPKTKYTSLPWILITNGKEGFEGALPKDKNALMNLLKQYGGN